MGLFCVFVAVEFYFCLFAVVFVCLLFCFLLCVFFFFFFVLAFFVFLFVLFVMQLGKITINVGNCQNIDFLQYHWTCRIRAFPT